LGDLWELVWTHDLPDGTIGLTCFDERTIYLADDLGQAERRCAIDHEVEHARRGAVPAHLEAREERVIDEISARRLIPLYDLADAMVWSDDEHQIADELWVDVDTLRARMFTLTLEETTHLNERLDEAEARIP
jgi:hypothetical protein